MAISLPLGESGPDFPAAVSFWAARESFLHRVASDPRSRGFARSGLLGGMSDQRRAARALYLCSGHMERRPHSSLLRRAVLARGSRTRVIELEASPFPILG